MFLFVETADEPFRTVLLSGAVILIPIALYHWLRSQASGEKLDRRQEGLFLLISIRLLGLASITGFLAYLIQPRWLSWSSLPFPAWLRWTGVGLGLLGGTLLVWTLHHLGKNLTDTVVTRREHTLITTGPYRWIRHPFYGSAGLTYLSNSLAAANWFIALTGGLVIALLAIRTTIEEAKLLDRFGDNYRRYMARTGKFFSRIRPDQSV